MNAHNTCASVIGAAFGCACPCADTAAAKEATAADAAAAAAADNGLLWCWWLAASEDEEVEATRVVSLPLVLRAAEADAVLARLPPAAAAAASLFSCWSAAVSVRRLSMVVRGGCCVRGLDEKGFVSARMGFWMRVCERLRCAERGGCGQSERADDTRDEWSSMSGQNFKFQKKGSIFKREEGRS